MKVNTLAAIFAASLLSGTAMAGTIHVRNGESIQEAVNRANSGDTVLVEPGTYSAFEVKRDGVTVKSSVQGGAHVIARGSNQPAIGVYGQNGVSILGFRLTSQRGDGMKIGGSPGRMVSDLTVEGNIVESAWLDGLKAFQAKNMSMSGNTIKASGVAGPAGQGANGNGDGGIDWVQIEDSEMEGNSISSRGWACMMVKNGSRGNRIAGNKATHCEVNGLDMAAGSSGRAAAANKSGKVAFDNVIEGNQLSSGRGCAAKFDETSTNNKLAGDNSVSGRVCDQNGSNNANATATADSAGSSSGGGYEAADGGSGGGGGGSGGMGTILASGALGGSCAGSGALSNGMAAAGAVASIWSGGRATAPLQIAQQMQLVAQRICQTEQLMAQLRMLTGMDLRTAGDVLSVLRRLEPMLRQGNFLMTDQAIMNAMQEAYPESFPEGSTYQDMEEQSIVWNERTRSALDQKTRIENSVIQEQGRALQRAAAIEQAGRDSGGIRGAQLATNALLTELMGSLDNQIMVATAHHRALSEVQYREEAERAAAKRDAEDFMRGLGDCPSCGTRPINIFEGQAAPVARRANTNDVFGTGVPGN